MSTEDKTHLVKLQTMIEKERKSKNDTFQLHFNVDKFGELKRKTGPENYLDNYKIECTKEFMDRNERKKREEIAELEDRNSNFNRTPYNRFEPFVGRIADNNEHINLLKNALAFQQTMRHTLETNGKLKCEEKVVEKGLKAVIEGTKAYENQAKEYLGLLPSIYEESVTRVLSQRKKKNNVAYL